MDILCPKNGILSAGPTRPAMAIQLPMVSVVVFNYNCGAYLRQAVESTLGQTYPNVECIVVDNAFTGESPMILADIETQYPNVNVIRHANHGHTPAALDGLAACRGAYVIFLDADDMLLPHCIETHVFVHLSLRIHVGFTSGDMLQVADNQVVVSTGSEFNRHIRRRKKISRNIFRPYDHACGAKWSTKHFAPLLAEKIYFIPPLSNKRVASPASGNCYRRDALLLFSDNPALAGLRTGTGMYFAHGIGALCGSVLIDEPVVAHRIHGHNMSAERAELNGVLNYATKAAGDNDGKAARLLLIDHLVANAARFAPNHWLRLNFIALISRLDCRDSDLDLPRWARRSRLAQQLVAHYGTIAPVLGRTVVKLLMLCARVPLRIILGLKDPGPAIH
jgi:glycosyltransferase involved in cell wall biosynthesis